MNWELFRTHKQHVLKEVCQAQRSVWVLKTTDSDRDGACTFFECGIFNEEYFNSVVEGEGFIFALIVWRLGREDGSVGWIFKFHV